MADGLLALPALDARKEARRVATRHEKLAILYLAALHLGIIRQLLKRLLPLSDKR